MKLRKPLHKLLLTALIALVAYLGLTTFISHRILFPPWYRPALQIEGMWIFTPCTEGQKKIYKYCGNPKSDFNIEFELMSFNREVRGRSMTVDGWFVPTGGATTARGTVILVHGAGEDRRAMLKHMPYLLQAGYNVLMIDCHNHGMSFNDGTGIGLGLWESESVLTAVDWALGRGLGPHIGVMGTSQGAVAALLAAASSQDIKAVVAENPFYSVRRLLREWPEMSWVPDFVRDSALIGISFWHGYDYRELNAHVFGSKVQSAVFIIHGSDDRLVPPQQAQDLYTELKGPKDFWLVPYGNHNVLWNKSQLEYEHRVTEFLGKYL